MEPPETLLTNSQLEFGTFFQAAAVGSGLREDLNDRVEASSTALRSYPPGDHSRDSHSKVVISAHQRKSVAKSFRGRIALDLFLA